MPVPVLKYKSIEEYLEAEETSVEKNEYHQGDIFAMAGGTLAHNQVVRNTLTAIDNFLRDKECQIFPSDLKVHIEANTLFTYPDLSIICNGPQFWKNRTDIVTNPVVLIEVLSKSTKEYDRGGKFLLYRDIPSLKEYILISSLEVRLEQYSKQSPNEWKFIEYKAVGEIVTIHSIGFSTALKELYRDVDFSLGE